MYKEVKKYDVYRVVILGKEFERSQEFTDKALAVAFIEDIKSEIERNPRFYSLIGEIYEDTISENKRAGVVTQKIHRSNYGKRLYFYDNKTGIVTENNLI